VNAPAEGRDAAMVAGGDAPAVGVAGAEAASAAGDIARAANASAAPRPWLAAVGRLFFRSRDLLFPLVLLPLLAFTKPRLPFGSPTADTVLDALGALVALSGQLLRALVIGLAYIRRGGLDRRPYADALVCEGLFAHSRNPLYLGNLLGIIGFALIHSSPWLYAVGVPFFVFAYLAIVAAEEEFLRGRFGADYEAYAREVPRFLPRLRGLHATIAGMTFDWRRLARKEYGTTFAGASALLLLLVFDRQRLYGPLAARWWLALALWLPLLAGYVTLRRLKKTGRLGRDPIIPRATG
jgi:protein-S-isoprenylcysteine O-methyltransferase Ste14